MSNHVKSHSPVSQKLISASDGLVGSADEQFLSTPLSEFWRHYGPSKGAANCEADFGYGLLKAWRDTNQTYCAPHGPGKGRVLGFTITTQDI